MLIELFNEFNSMMKKYFIKNENSSFSFSNLINLSDNIWFNNFHYIRE